MFESMKSVVITTTFIASKFFVDYQSFKRLDIIFVVVIAFGTRTFLSLSNINKRLKNK